MKELFLEIEQIELDIKNIQGEIERDEHILKDFGGAYGFSEKQTMRVSIQKMKDKLRRFKCERISKLESLHIKVEFEIRMANGELRGSLVEVSEGLFLDNDSDL